jgi:Fe-S-cluster containining protein
MGHYPLLDLHALAAEAGVDLDDAMARLMAIYDDIDARNARNTADLDLPCHRGCSACCEASVFVSPLEFFTAWHWAQEHLDDEVRDRIVYDALRIYRAQQPVIDALSGPVPEGEDDHTSLAEGLAFRCPILSDEGVCQIYPAREVYARLFGCSFNDDRGVYGCDLVGAHLTSGRFADQEITLVKARENAARLLELPLSRLQQVYPWYFHWVYGGLDDPEPPPSSSRPTKLPVL